MMKLFVALLLCAFEKLNREAMPRSGISFPFREKNLLGIKLCFFIY